jgi:hypothetical protein
VQLHLVKEVEERPVWVAVLAHEKMYTYVTNTGKFRDNDALRNDSYLDRGYAEGFTYEEIGPAEARRLMDHGVGRLDETEHSAALVQWRPDPKPLDPADVLSIAAGYNR